MMLFASSIFGMICKEVFSIYGIKSYFVTYVLIILVYFYYLFYLLNNVWYMSGVKIIPELNIFPFVFTFDTVLKSFIPQKYVTLHGHLECSQGTYWKTEDQ